jgi:hypothetical protein
MIIRIYLGIDFSSQSKHKTTAAAAKQTSNKQASKSLQQQHRLLSAHSLIIRLIILPSTIRSK